MEILVHVDQYQQSQNRLKTAVALAERFQARLIGLAVAPDPATAAAMIGPAPMDVYPLLQEAMDENFRLSQAQFEAAMATTTIRNEFRRDTGDTVQRLALHAHYADLTVVGQSDPSDEIHEALDHSLPLLAGGPVLVVPYVGTFAMIGARPMIAWNGSRQAARAVKDAMPFLTRAKAVDVVAVVGDRSEVEEAQVNTTDLCAFLARHNVRAEGSQLMASEIEIADLLVSRMADLGNDLLVMGAYGHSRFRELVMGGVTRGILKTSPVPLLLAH